MVEAADRHDQAQCFANANAMDAGDAIDGADADDWFALCIDGIDGIDVGSGTDEQEGAE